MAQRVGLDDASLILTGHVPDAELVALYNLCAAMAFPSYDEGFGLPVLEALSCGAVTIGANAASVPEVLGRDDALFDPYDEYSIAAKLEQVLTDEALRASLREHGPVQARRFSWDDTACLSLDAMEKLAKGQRSAYSARESRFPDALDLCVDALARFPPPPDADESAALSRALAISFLPRKWDRQLLVDVSELITHNSRTGCQRVTRGVLLEFLKHPPEGFRVQPVYAVPERDGYFYARDFARLCWGNRPLPPANQ